MSTSPLVIGHPNFEPHPECPVLPPNSLGLDLRLLPARTQGGTPTLALFGAARIPGRYGDLYGGRLHGAILIVAIDPASGAVFHGTPESGDVIPLALVLKPDPPPPDPGVARRLSSEICFSLDLRPQLQLPAHASKYTVFLWLDDLISPVRRADLPGTAAPPPAPRPDLLDPDFRFRRTPKTPPAAQSILLSLDRTRVYGSLPTPAGAVYLSVLALDFRSRTVQWKSYPLPASDSEVGFDFDIYEQFGRPKPGWLDPALPHQRLFLLACAGAAMAPVLAFTPQA